MINVAAAYLKERMDKSLTKYSKKRREKRELEKKETEEKITLISESDIEFIEYGFLFFKKWFRNLYDLGTVILLLIIFSTIMIIAKDDQFVIGVFLVAILLVIFIFLFSVLYTNNQIDQDEKFISKVLENRKNKKS